MRPQTLNLEQKLRELGRDLNLNLGSVAAIRGLMGSKDVHTKMLASHETGTLAVAGLPFSARIHGMLCRTVQMRCPDG